MQTQHSQPSPYLLFGTGAAVGSALGLIIGALLMLWLGDEVRRAVQSGLRRLSSHDDRPDPDVFMQ